MAVHMINQDHTQVMKKFSAVPQHSFKDLLKMINQLLEQNKTAETVLQDTPALGEE